MEYNTILKRIEEQKKDEQLSAKLYRYAGLIHAIEFFSQKLNFDQIIDAAFDFINELLTLERSAVFILQGSNFVLKKSKSNNSDILLVKNSKELQDLAMLHGTLLHEELSLEKYFDRTLLDTYSVTIAIPLIIENLLFGFIFISNKTEGDLNGDDYIISEALMKLFNNALENYKRFEQIQKANRELDEKIFNLFAINQSSKALLSELSLDVLYNLSVDVFSELTQSSVTSFILYDEKSEKYRLRAFKDVHYRDVNIHISLTLNKTARVDVNKIIINTSDSSDVAYFNNMFMEGLEELKSLGIVYIIMLIKNGKILGFVTLGKTVTGTDYKNSMFELIESLASATYISLSNAQLFRQVNEQKKVIQNKLEKLVSLNNLMKNVNSSAKVETLLSLTLKTLSVAFEVQKGLIALYNKEENVFDITETVGIDTERTKIEVTSKWRKVLEGDTVYEATQQSVLKFIGERLVADIGEVSGILIVPIYIDRVNVEVLGAIIIFKYQKNLISDEENILTVETIANHIAPVLSNLFTIEEQKRFLLPDHIQLFKRDLKSEINAALEFATVLKVVQVTDCRDFVFKGSAIADTLKEGFNKCYPFSYNNIFIITSETDEEIYAKIEKLTGLDSVKIRIVTLGKEFNNFQDFFKMF